MTRWVVGAAVCAWFGLALGCEGADPCQDYVDYLCDCHAGEPGYDCETLQQTYSAPDAALQDQCALDLEAQQAQDAEDGLACADGASGS
jgi:hypothetical protein